MNIGNKLQSVTVRVDFVVCNFEFFLLVFSQATIPSRVVAIGALYSYSVATSPTL